ncbi:Pectinesterase [Quillaja saponaria]|uniref:Pectinesterase n=1 Tax=Quillaja saponaria TaxID=32244 RepID=A0AAD7VJK0_QUISA|nr:Pectinesterase [Quillaja saponaria]
MATTFNLYTTLYTIVSLSLLILISFPSLATPHTTCNSTLHPSFCTSTLPSDFSGTIHDHSRFFLRQSLSTTKTFLQLISSYLKDPSSLPASTLLALQDCQVLAQLNNDFLSNTLQTISYTDILSPLQVYDFQTMLSAILTNQQTCLDGLHEVTPYPSVTTGLLSPLSDGTKLYSISLSLFTHGWVGDEANRERQLTQKNIDNVNVKEKVVVNPYGSGNFTSINDAVAAAPNNTGTNNGYFVIYVVAGIYNEYVSIAKSKQNLMIIGEGINRTIITGNRSVVDGWTTFNSATFAVVGKGFVAVNITFSQHCWIDQAPSCCC